MFTGAGVCLGQDKNIRISVNILNNHTNDKNNDWLGLGLVNDIIRNLRRIKGLQLVATEQMKEAASNTNTDFSGLIDEKTTVKYAKSSGVKYLILGSFRADGKALTADYRMIDVKTEAILFDEMVKGDPESVMEMEEKGARKILSTLAALYPKLRIDKGMFSREYSRSAHYNYNKGLACAIKSDFTGGIECFQKVIDEIPGSGDAYLGQGDIYLSNGNTLMALVKLNKALSIYTNNIDKYFINWTHYKIGEVYFYKGDYDNASKFYQKALEYKVYNDMFRSSIYTRLAEIEQRNNRPKTAIKYAEKAVKESKRVNDKFKQVSTMADLAKLYSNAGMLDKAKIMSDEALKIAKEIGIENEGSMAG
jgi:tetratricopeptide (TPR) repeat protein